MTPKLDNCCNYFLITSLDDSRILLPDYNLRMLRLQRSEQEADLAVIVTQNTHKACLAASQLNSTKHASLTSRYTHPALWFKHSGHLVLVEKFTSHWCAVSFRPVLIWKLNERHRGFVVQ